MSRDRVGEVLRAPQYDDEPAPTFPGVYSGTVSKVDAKGLYFTIPSYGRDQEFGPAPWAKLPASTGNTGGGAGDAEFAAHSHTVRPAGNPPKGTQLAVAFADGDVDKPLVLQIYGWPA